MVPRMRLATTVWTGCLMLAIGLGGCGSVALQPGGTAGADGGAAGAAGGSTGTAGSGPAGHGGVGAGGAGGSEVGGSLGTVTLRLDLPPATSFCDVSCGGVGSHITILTREGKPVPTEHPSCVGMCTASCVAVSCPVGGACLLTGVALTGAELTWDGSTYPTSTCGGGVACYRSTFAPAGKYIARMCATPGKLGKPADSPPVCDATGAPSCVDVVFAYPTSGVVEGTLDGVAPTCGFIRTSDYDQSCKADSDCVAVSQGNFCNPTTCTNCLNGAISAHAQTQYQTDFESRIASPTTCPCPSSRPPVCTNFQCGL
jgi:hypothetical protein